MTTLRRLVDEQAEDEGLWFIAQTAPEAYLQQELRRLHAAIEAEAVKPWRAFAMVASAMAHNGEKRHGKPDDFPTCSHFLCAEFHALAKPESER